MPERDELDRLIDSELAHYAEPRTGLEQRVLARVEAKATHRPALFGRIQWWTLAGAVAAIALVVLVLAISRNAPRETNVITAHSTNPDRGSGGGTKTTPPDTHVQLPHTQQIAKTQHAARKPNSFSVPERVQRPKLDVFPAPQPLSAEEQALVAIATARSDSARENLIASQRQLDAPLQISSIEIPPLTRPDEGNK